MNNRKALFITSLDKLLNSKELTEHQKDTLAEFDKFNEVESGCRVSTRESYVKTLHTLGLFLRKPYEEATKEDLQTFISVAKQNHKNGLIELYKTHLKRFYRWLEWVKTNKDKPDEEKMDLKDVKLPYCARWMKVSWKTSTEIPFESLPTEQEVLSMAENARSERNRALLLTLWETGCSPLELLNLRIRDVVFSQYGATVMFPKYVDVKTKEINELKTEHRYRQVPVRTCVADLSLWISMHPQKNDLNSPLWWCQKGGGLGYQQFSSIFHSARKKAGITRRLYPYLFRHARLSQVGNVLSQHELKRYAGHSRYSNVTPRYLHADEKEINRKILAERGLQIAEEQKPEPLLKPKICERCKHENSPAAKFCQNCSLPLDIQTMFEAQKKAELLEKGHEFATGNEEFAMLMQAFNKLPTEKVKEIQRQMWQQVAVEIVKEQMCANANAR